MSSTYGKRGIPGGRRVIRGMGGSTFMSFERWSGVFFGYTREWSESAQSSHAPDGLTFLFIPVKNSSLPWLTARR